jgi:hypothetical protein
MFNPKNYANLYPDIEEVKGCFSKEDLVMKIHSKVSVIKIKGKVYGIQFLEDIDKKDENCMFNINLEDLSLKEVECTGETDFEDCSRSSIYYEFPVKAFKHKIVSIILTNQKLLKDIYNV